LSAAVTIGGGAYKATIDTGATASFISKELADNLAALGKIRRIRRQVRLADRRCGGIDEQLEVEIAFGNKRLSMSLLILPGVVDSLVLGWNFLTQVGTEIKCAGHEVIILARNRHKGWLEEKWCAMLNLNSDRSAVSSDDSHVVVMLVPPSSVFISPNKTSAGEQYHLYYKRIVTTN